MRSLIPIISEASGKYLRLLTKNLPNKIYSVEIKIRSENKPLEDKTQQLKESNTNIDTTTINTETSSIKINNLEQETTLKSTDELKQINDSKTNKPKTNFISNDPEDITFVSQTQIIERTKNLVKSLNCDSSLLSNPSLSLRTLLSLNSSLKELNKHIENYPEASNLIIRENVIPKLLQIRELSQKQIIKRGNNKSSYNIVNENPFRHLKENSRRALGLLGHTDPPKGRGIKILSIDGGGTRGLVVIEILREIEKQCGKPIHEIFDLICGVSTGAIITMLLGALRTPLDECEDFYKQVSSYLFKTDILRGTGRLLWSHSYYDTAMFEKILKDVYGDKLLIDTRRNEHCPHIMAISAIVNLPTLQPYLFRNYQHHPSSRPLNHFEGGYNHQIWQAVRASAAAPGYFEEFTLGSHVHQDGGILLNNPTAVAVHEAKLLWPNEHIQCVLSLGSGRYQPTDSFEHVNNAVILSSLKHKLLRLIDSATDTEMIHRLMNDHLPQNAYYRINPVLRDQANIDESRPEKLEAMKVDAQMYLRRNEYKFKSAIEQLKQERSYSQSLVDTIRLSSKLYL
ncbi:hypothetical protein RDWZM_000802 [Blomia tropicalis]|uniref:PNPLA domain-containing protein n=1 Tax=Blomia tropicalis TaxID=40697 RepID=A0A9Q0MDI5_BLOTA|nr:hypothetical protein RDWZM_000802 [Blomia tropicalis]